jgi:phosphocarrier protein
MQKIKVKVQDANGLHLRPAAKIVEKSKQFKSQITVNAGERHAEGSSVLELMLLQAGKDTELEITASGEDEALAAAGLAMLFVDGAGI